MDKSNQELVKYIVCEYCKNEINYGVGVMNPTQQNKAKLINAIEKFETDNNFEELYSVLRNPAQQYIVMFDLIDKLKEESFQLKWLTENYEYRTGNLFEWDKIKTKNGISET